jgi:hypothetical protein
MSFVGFTCWAQKDALKLLATEALEGDEALFLATHHPLPAFDLGGSRAALVAERSERGLLAALTHAENRHVFCVVEGEPGSGKSHLIRWLYVKWPKRGSQDLVLLIQRADGSLEGTLQSLRDGLPSEYRPIFDGLGRTSQVTEDGRRKDFQTKLANSMEKAYFDAPPEDADWCAQRGIAPVLGHEKLREMWGAPRRILHILSGKGSSGDVRDQELARFTIKDVIQIGQLSRDIRGVPVAALRWLRDLKKETDLLQGFPDTSADAELTAAGREQFPETIGLLAALDRRLNNAIQELLGSTARQLDELFKKLRRQLRAEGRRLVLLLEDVTNFQGVDEKLIDALVFNADTREDDVFCDMISVLGVTPDYFHRYIETKSNYAQRITQHVRLLSGQEGSLGGFAVPFAARYLRAIRAGQARLEGFDGEGEIFNSCTQCVHRAACHQAFGEDDGVGLYPFTARAITQMFSHLRDPSGAMTVQTPRGLIQNVLNPTLHRPDAIERGEYPHPAIETEYLPRRSLDGSLRAAIEQRQEHEQEPLRRLLSWWGEPSQRERASVDDRGNPLFQGIPLGAFEAFDLPWMGDDGVVVTTPVAETTGPLAHRGFPPEGERIQRPTALPPIRPRPAGPTASPWELKAAQLQKRQDQLTQWWNGGPLDEGESFWNKWLHRLMTVEVPWRRMGISPWLQATLFTDARVMIAGTKQSRDHFVAPKTTWLRDGLEAFITLQTRPVPATDLDYHRYRLVRLVRKLEVEISAHVERSLTPVQGGSWAPVGLVVQIAIVRAWLRGTLRPGTPLVDQWAYLFAPEPSAEAAPKKRVESWLDLTNRTAAYPSELDKRLRHMVNQPQGAVSPGQYGVCDLGMADPSDAIAAMSRLLERLEFSPYPSSKEVKFDSFLTNALQMTEEMGAISQVPAREGRRLLDLAGELEAASPGDSLQEFARRVQEVMVKVSGILPSAPNDAIQGWTQRYAEVTQRGFLAPGAEARLERLDDFKVNGRKRALEDFLSPMVLLDWCIQVPADDVLAARDLVRQADTSLARVLAHAEDVVDGAATASGATLQQLHDSGAALNKSCGALIDAIREER